MAEVLTDEDYQHLLTLRVGLRRFLHWSERRAAEVGLTAKQHQLLLAIRGHGDPRGPTIGDVAAYLLLRHHSAVGLVQRAEGMGLIERHADAGDRRMVRLALSAKGNRALEGLSELHVEELSRLMDDLRPLWHGIEDQAAERHGNSRAFAVRAKRIYDPVEADDGVRVLVDRLWPRGMKKEDAHFDEWSKDAAPTPDLRRWYGHRPERFPEFADRYRRELATSAGPASARLLALAADAPLTLLTSTRDLPRSGAAVLADELLRRHAEQDGK